MDIEDDPTQDFIYLHGIYERKQDSERFVSLVAKDNTEAEEEKAWQDLINYLRSYKPGSFSLYYYSPYEKTSYQRLRKKYSRAISEKELDDIFSHANTIDLYSLIYRHTDWLLWSYSLKHIELLYWF